MPAALDSPATALATAPDKHLPHVVAARGSLFASPARNICGAALQRSALPALDRQILQAWTRQPPQYPVCPVFANVSSQRATRSVCSGVCAWPVSRASSSFFGAVMRLYEANMLVGGQVSSLKPQV